MAYLHYFYPENDLALARNIEHYTAPPAAARLRNAGATLPLWYGEAGDAALTDGVNAAWLGRMRDAFDLRTDIFRHTIDGLEPMPWGWSKPVVAKYKSIGYCSDFLPSDSDIEALRQLSHRRTASVVAGMLAEAIECPLAPAAVEVNCIDDLDAFLTACGAEGAVVKLPWSSSGRGLVAVDNSSLPQQRAMIEGMIRKQGSVMVERRLRKVMDFAMLFTVADGLCHFDGYSVFCCSRLGSYEGNILAPQSGLRQMVARHTGCQILEDIATSLTTILGELCGHVYHGPLGVDMMVVDHPDYCLAPVVEVNLRNTMGHVCRNLYARHIADGAEGFYSVQAAQNASEPYRWKASCGRLEAGMLNLAQPGEAFAFNVRIRD